MVLVTVSEINESLETLGKINLCGIHSDFIEACLKPESRSILADLVTTDAVSSERLKPQAAPLKLGDSAGRAA